MRPNLPLRLPQALMSMLCLAVLSLSLSGCAGTPPQAATLPPLPRAKPAEAMVPCPASLPALPPGIDQIRTPAPPKDGQRYSAVEWAQIYADLVLQVRGKLQTVLDIHVEDTDAFYSCSQRQAAEAAWIQGN